MPVADSGGMTTQKHPRLPVRLSVRTPVDLIAAVPYLIGFHPEDCVLVLGTDGRDNAINFAAGYTPLTTAGPLLRELADSLARSFLEQGGRRAVILGYGPEEPAVAGLFAVRDRLASHGAAVAETLRVTKDRYWSYECANPVCCPAEGVVYDVHRSTIPATAVAAGLRVRASREELLALVAPVGGARRAAMTRATRQAEERCARLRREAGDRGEVAVIAEGVRTVRTVVAAALDGAPPPKPDTVAWLSVLLVHPRVRDEAWAHIDRAHLTHHVGLWSHVLRHVDPDYAAAPAALLGFAAWQNDDPFLADVAVDRALEVDPEYSMARLVRRAVRYGLPPHRWEGFTPDWLAEYAPISEEATPQAGHGN